MATIGLWSLKAYHSVGLNATHRRSRSARARDEHVVILAGDAPVARIGLRPGARAVLPERLELGQDDLDVAGKRARTRSKGGDTDWLFFGSAIAFVSGAAPRLRALRRRRSGRPGNGTASPPPLRTLPVNARTSVSAMKGRALPAAPLVVAVVVVAPPPGDCP